MQIQPKHDMEASLDKVQYSLLDSGGLRKLNGIVGPRKPLEFKSPTFNTFNNPNTKIDGGVAVIIIA